MTSILYHNFFLCSWGDKLSFHTNMQYSFCLHSIVVKGPPKSEIKHYKCFIVLEMKDSIICKITCHSSCSNLWIATMYILMIYCLSQGSKSKCLNNFQTALIHVYAISDTKQNLTYMTCTTNMVNPFPLILVFFLLKHNYRLLWTY